MLAIQRVFQPLRETERRFGRDVGETEQKTSREAIAAALDTPERQGSGGEVERDEKTEDRSISSKPNLLVLFYPCVDETTPEEVSYGGDAIGGHGREVSPLYHIAKGLPAIMIFQGTADSLYAENKQYCAAARAAGNACELVEYAGAPHGFFAPGGDNNNWYEESLRAMDSYLTRVGYLLHQH